MVLSETIGKLLLALVEGWITILKIIISIIWATFRLVYPAEERSVSNDIILITGSGHGIGRELARQYGLLGAQIVCVDVNPNNNRSTMKMLKELEIRSYEYICDVSDRQAVQALAAKVRKDVGFVTILVNNAGIMPCKKFRDHTAEEKERVFAINVYSHFWTLEAFLPAMIANDYGHIIALSSIAGLGGYANIVPYCASKFAVRGLMDGLAAEMKEEKHNINFTTVYPFAVDTGLCKKPRIGLPSILDVQRTEDVAARIISAQRRGHKDVSIPFFIQFLHNLESLLPDKARQLIDDASQTGVDCDN